MYYEINVSKGDKKLGIYQHLFATAPRSVQSEYQASVILKEFKVKFPSPEYNISVTRWDEIGHGVNLEDILNHNK